jgi:hypothetical protein
MDSRQKKLFLWSAILGFVGWLTWELNSEAKKAEIQSNEADRRKALQRKHRS